MIRRRHFTRAHALVLAALACLFAWPLSAHSDTWTIAEEDWYIMEIAGSKAGWSSSIEERSETAIRTTTDVYMKIDRGATPIEITMKSIFIESADYKPISMEFEQKMAQQVMRSVWEFQADGVVHTAHQGGRKTVKNVPLPTVQWFTPAAADAYAQAQRKSGVDQFTYKTIDPEAGVSPITVTSKRAGQEQVEHDGASVPVTLWNTTTDLVPIAAIEKYTAEGDLLVQEVNMMGLGKMVMRRASKAQALEAGDGKVPELLFATIIKPDKPIERPMKASKAKLRLRIKDGEIPDLPSSGAQRVEVADDRKSAILTIDINENQPASAADLENKEYIEASTMVDVDDPMVQKLAGSGKNDDEADTQERAEALRRLVRKHISAKGMETAFASASETARTRTGDCSEHGVLLCAVMRAQGIPARVATGLVYADAFAGAQDIFGWHMWTQALIDGKWVDYDATIPVRHNATHVLTATSSLSDGLGATDLASVIQLIGNLEIDVLEVQYD